MDNCRAHVLIKTRRRVSGRSQPTTERQTSRGAEPMAPPWAARGREKPRDVLSVTPGELPSGRSDCADKGQVRPLFTSHAGSPGGGGRPAPRAAKLPAPRPWSLSAAANVGPRLHRMSTGSGAGRGSSAGIPSLRGDSAAASGFAFRPRRADSGAGLGLPHARWGGRSWAPSDRRVGCPLRKGPKRVSLPHPAFQIGPLSRLQDRVRDGEGSQ